VTRPNESKIVRVADQLRRGDDVQIIDGPRLDKFDPQRLAMALEQECERSKVMGWPKVSLHMDVIDALLLARALKKVGR